MQAIILAAGRGKRLAPLTDNTPKPLIEVNGTPIIERLLESLPDKIEEVIIVTEYLEKQIKSYVGNTFNNKNIIYVTQGQKKGTYGAFFSAKLYVKSENFLVLGGDDLFDSKELENMCAQKLAFGVHKKFLPGKEWLIIQSDEDKNVRAMIKPTDEEFKNPQYMATGVYVLDQSFWGYEPVQLTNGEYGLPQTIRPMMKAKEIKMMEMKEWLQINTHEELAYAEKYLGKRHI